MSGYPYLHFFNVQYWYCVIYSLLGGECTDAELAAGGLGATSGANAPGASTTPGLWEWLFGGWWNAAFGPGSILGTAAAFVGGFVSFLWALWSAIAYTVSFLLLLVIIGAALGLFLVRAKDESRYGNLLPAAEKPHPLRERWQELLQGAMSSDPRRWREGILGADELLGELFAKLGYSGKTTAERIRSIPDGAFANLPAAWEAHRIRNFVSSPTSHVILTQREAFRVMKLYEQVFREFDFI